MTSRPFPARRLAVRLALVFAVVQLVAAAAVLLTIPAVRSGWLWLPLLGLLAVVDLALLAIFAGWIIRGSMEGSTQGLASDVQRIADGDYHHRVGDPHRPELREIRDSVNRLADRLIADQRLLAANIRSLEETNRELVSVRDQMVQSARLASVGTLASGIAHEVGNPLGAVIAFVDVARMRAERAGEDTEILDSIRSEAIRIDRIVRGLLDYARAPDTSGRPERASHVLADVRELLQNQGKLDAVDLVWDIAEDARDLVTEPHRLQQVLVNLVLNALDALADRPNPQVRMRLYGEQGDLMRLRPRREDDPPGIDYMHRRRLADDDDVIDLVSRASRVTVIEVEDNGPGISPHDIDHIFDPFFTTKEPGKGTGLGLAICARLVEGMGGRIDASKGAEGGARFVIRLPGLEDPDSATVVPSGSAALEA